MMTICFKAGIEEVGTKTAKFEAVIRSLTPNYVEMLPPVVTPLTEGMVLVTISYNWGYKFPAPQNFEEMFGDNPNKKFLRESYVDSMRESWGK